MTEPKIWEMDLPDVSMEDVFRAEGSDFTNRSPRPGMVELHRRILLEASALVRPIVVWREVSVAGAGEKELFLEEGHKLTSRLLVKVAGPAEKLILYALTIGSALDDRVDAYKKAGKLLEAFTLDAAGSAFVAKSAAAALAKIEEGFHSAGIKTTFPMGPGHSYWSGLEDLRTIYHLLKAESIGLRLTDSNLMMPRKSIAMVLGVGRNLPDFKGKDHCDFCSLQKTCNMNKFAQNC
ncbi:hypothetical protein [Zhaonella formicivorans]|uniref:hypothetical protein n=1 Tax=Zhaonella formicivorans TaxID=2528593 RepID=UPI0010EF5EF4|nr:hypothetical protein [Zhaonella formicivorans]